MNKKINYGFVRPIIQKDHYVLGGVNSLPKIILQPDGKWSPFFPKYEPQSNDNFETYACTVFGTENVIETILKKTTGYEYNFSERFIYILAHVSPPGADPHFIAECIRKNGLINNDLLPMTDSLEEFVQPDPMSEMLVEKGKAWPFELGHEWVWEDKQLTEEQRKEKIREALKYSPLGVSVTAWYEENGIYVDNGEPNNHWCVLGEETDKGWLIFDSYDHSTKILSFDHKISFCKRYYIKKKDQRKNWVIELLNNLWEFFRDILTLPKQKYV